MRNHEFLISEANGRLSRDDGNAAIDLAAGDVVYFRAATEAVASSSAAVTGVAMVGANNAATKFTAGQSLVLGVGEDNDVIFDFFDGNAGAYGGDNSGIDVQTTAPVSLTTALAAIQTAWRAHAGADDDAATIGIVGGVLAISTGHATASLNIEGDVDLLATLEIEDAVYEYTPATAATDAGYADFANGLTDDEKATAGVVLSGVFAGETATVVARLAEVNANHISFPAGTTVQATAALAAKNVIVR